MARCRICRLACGLLVGGGFTRRRQKGQIMWPIQSVIFVFALQVNLHHELREAQRRERGLLRGLEHDAVAAGLHTATEKTLEFRLLS